MSKRLVLVLALALANAGGCAHARVRPIGPERPAVDSLRTELERLQEGIRARDDTIRALRLELQALKEIDLRRRPGNPGGTGGGGI